MRARRVAMLLLIVGLILQTGCCRLCRRWCGPETHCAPAPAYCAPACCPPPCCAPATGYAPASYAAPQGDCCTNACTTPAPATGAAPAGNQWQRTY